NTYEAVYKAKSANVKAPKTVTRRTPKRKNQVKKIANTEKKKNKTLKEKNIALRKEKEKWKKMFKNLKLENDKDKEKIKELEKTLATKETEIETLEKDKERYKLEAKTWKELYEKAKEEKEQYETLYNACITNHEDYDHIKKELEKITKEHDDYKRDLKKSQEEKRKINIEIQKNVQTIITLVKKFLLYLMRQIIEQFEKLAESDIAIRLVFISVYTGQIRNLFEITLLEEIGEIAFSDLTSQQWVDHYKIPVAGGATLLTPLLSKIELNFYLVRICDKDLAKKIQNDVTLADILINPKNLENPELKDYFDILATYYREISFCMLPEEDEIDQNIFDTANFALIMMKKTYQNTTTRSQNQQQQDPRYLTDALSYYLGEKFSLLAGQSGLPQLQQGQNGNGGNPMEEDEPDAEI
ncbi:27615_t:CDS:2, partial [Racocetra persica]